MFSICIKHISWPIKIQDGTNPVPSSWIVQEPPPATSSCSSPCSSWVARVSLKRQNHSLLFIPNYYPILSDILLDGVQALSTSASPSLSTKPCSGSNWSQITQGVFLLWEIAGSNSMGFQLYQLSSSFAQRFLPQIFTSWTFSCYISGAS